MIVKNYLEQQVLKRKLKPSQSVNDPNSPNNKQKHWKTIT